MTLQGFHLLAQLVWIGPIVISLAESDIASADQREQEGLRDGDALRILVLRLVDSPDAGGIAGFVVADDVRRAVGRGIVVHENFDPEGRPLGHETLEGVADQSGLVVSQADDGHAGVIHR